MEAGLQAMAAGGSLMVGTLQGGAREATRFEPDRDANGAMTDPAAFNAFLGRVRAGGLPHFFFFNFFTDSNEVVSCI